MDIEERKSKEPKPEGGDASEEAREQWGQRKEVGQYGEGEWQTVAIRTKANVYAE